MVVGGSSDASTSGVTEGVAKVLVREDKRKKLGPEIVDAVFLGIPSSVSLDDSLASTSIPKHVEKMSNVGVNPSSTSPTHEESDEPKRSKRAGVVQNFGRILSTYNIEDDPNIQRCYRTWVLFDLPLECTTIGSLALVYNLPIHRMDVTTIFLYGELEEKIYTDQFEGFVAHDDEHKDMGEADAMLGIKLVCLANGIAISQSHYVEKIIEKFVYQNSRIAKTLYDSSVALLENESVVLVAQLRRDASSASLETLPYHHLHHELCSETQEDGPQVTAMAEKQFEGVRGFMSPEFKAMGW
ncbi:hypothetical protein Sango_2052500 [Sesamum angolense]|uniref:Uncharacterized protein n=1 Tax=Sesamum angolense TaxID=2727404 RepID=A0AAE2BPA2_9LAMI|nr:hypothetical protein Sango_2052500 [Sesamum angolense]